MSPRSWLPAVLLLLAVPAAAHDFAVTRVRGELDGNRLALTLELNPVDILGNVLNDGRGRTAFDSEDHVREAAGPVVAYVPSRVRIEADGRPVDARAVLPWPREPIALTTRDSTGASIPAPIPFTLRCDLPAGTKTVMFAFDLYAEGDFLPLFDFSIARPATGWTRTEFLKARQTVSIDLDRLRDGRPAGTPAPVTSVLARFTALGFTHILPLGLDHILFVLGLFLLAPGLKPLLKQVTAFTVAHSITLALAMLGVVSLPSRIVEPAIALSIAVIAIENVFHRGVNRWRWAIVFGFGLVHGLGFAGVLRELTLPSNRFFPALVGFNAGVELGQLAVITGATLLTLPVARRDWYPRFVAIPASLAIAGVGFYWAVQRITG